MNTELKKLNDEIVGAKLVLVQLEIKQIKLVNELRAKFRARARAKKLEYLNK